MSRPFDAILLDAGNTLVFVDPSRTTEILRRHGATGDVARFTEVEREARILLSRAAEEGVTGTEGHFWEVYFLTLYRGMGLPEPATRPATDAIIQEHARDHLWTHVLPGTDRALQGLLDAGYRLAVVSNADGRVQDLLEHVGLGSFFELVVDSEVVGMSKPDPRIFHAALERLGVEPTRTLYVGDLYPVDVVGARRAGMEALLLDPFDALGHWTDVRRIPSVLRLPEALESL